MEFNEILEQVQTRGGLLSPLGAERVTARVLGALGEVLLDDELAALRAAVPPELRSALPEHASGADSSLERFFARVRRLGHTSFSQAIEQSEAVCEVLGGALPHDLRARWARDLPPRIAALFTTPPRPRSLTEPTAHRRAEPDDAPPRALAEGHPRSAHPLSEPPPPRGHRHSIARSEAPHADIKLSSSRGMTQEREHESLAEAQPRHYP